MRARCSWSQVSAFQHYSNLPLASSISQSLYSSPHALPPLSDLICRHSPLLPFALPPFIPAQAFWTLPVVLPANHTFHFGSSSTAYTGTVIHCLLLCPFRPLSILQTSVGSGLLIPFTFYTPLPSTTPPPPPPYPPLPNTQNPAYSDPYLHWWFSMWGAQPSHPTDGSLPLTHQPINLHLPNPLNKHTLRAYLNARHEDTWYRHVDPMKLYIDIMYMMLLITGLHFQRLLTNSHAPSVYHCHSTHICIWIWTCDGLHGYF